MGESSPVPPRKVTDEDKEAAETELMPSFGILDPEEFTALKSEFAREHGLALGQVDMIILELRRKARP